MVTGNLLLQEVAKKDGIGIAGNHLIRDALSVMHRNGKGVVVVLEGNRPTGIITERDAVRLLFAGVDMSDIAGDHATKPLIVTNGKRSIGYALGLIVENKIRRLVVVDDQGDFTGVVTQQDLLESMEDDFYRAALKVKHILNQVRVLCGAEESDTLYEILRKMVEGDISAVPIIKDNIAVGIITEKDILRVANENISLQEEVTRHMSSPVLTAVYETKLIDIVDIMHEKNIRRIVINNDQGNAVGILTSRDLVRNIEGDYNEFLERKLNSSKDILNLLPEMLLELVDTGRESFVVWANDKVLNKFGRSLIDKPATNLIPGRAWKNIHEILVKKQKVEALRFKIDDCVYELSGFYVPLEKTLEKGRIQLILKDITEEVMLASIDPLTSIYNRRYISQHLAKETERSKRTKKEFAVVIIDVDDFKKINDTYGHLAGDSALQEIVLLILKGIRKYDVVGRYGGEEFLLIMPEIAKEPAVNVLERMRKNIESSRIKLGDGTQLSVTVSFGLSAFREDGDSPDDLLLKADERLYKAKKQGKNRVVSS